MSKKPTDSKCIFIGDQGVGKLHIIYRIVYNAFGPDPNTKTERAFFTKELNLPNKSMRLKIWSTCGAERFRSLAPMFYRGAAGAFLVYDITNRDSFNSLAGWLGEMMEMCDSKMRIILLGNKSDEEDERMVSYEEGENFAKENDLVFFEVSAKTSENITKAVTKLAELMPEDEPMRPVCTCCGEFRRRMELEYQQNQAENWLVKAFFQMKKVFFCCKRKIKEGPKCH